MEKQLDELENLIGYHFNDQGLLAHAMTHSSSANEKHLGKLGSNERLEFLGDAVLELVSSDYLYSKYPKITEGELTKKRASMVCEPSLAFCARRFDLPRFILLGKGEEMTGGRKRDSIVSDATEALIGAIYLDGGFERAASFIRSFILDNLGEQEIFSDSKTILQEIVQEEGSQAVEYRLVSEQGPDHDKSFTVHVLLGSRILGEGTGHTKKAAEQAAAAKAVKELKDQNR